MLRRMTKLWVPGLLALVIAGCGETSQPVTPTPKPTPTAPVRPPVEIVKAALVAAGDVPGSQVGESPTEGSESALVSDGLVPTPCIKTSGITSRTRTPWAPT